MKQKVVIKVCMNCPKSRSKALKIAVGAPGIESAALEGDAKDQIVVTGDGFDSIALTKSLRKNFSYADLVSVEPIDKKKEKEKKSEVIWTQVGIPRSYYIYDAPPTDCGSCTIM